MLIYPWRWEHKDLWVNGIVCGKGANRWPNAHQERTMQKRETDDVLVALPAHVPPYSHVGLHVGLPSSS
jgi:hypothetical protein